MIKYKFDHVDLQRLTLFCTSIEWTCNTFDKILESGSGPSRLAYSRKKIKMLTKKLSVTPTETKFICAGQRVGSESNRPSFSWGVA
jgi:hypothetical protein